MSYIACILAKVRLNSPYQYVSPTLHRMLFLPFKKGSHKDINTVGKCLQVLRFPLYFKKSIPGIALLLMQVLFLMNTCNYYSQLSFPFIVYLFNGEAIKYLDFGELPQNPARS